MQWEPDGGTRSSWEVIVNDLLGGLESFLRSLIGGGSNPADAVRHAATNGTTPIDKKVLVISYNPRIRSRGAQPLNKIQGWNDPQKLTDQYVADMLECSYGYVRYQVVQFMDLDEWPLKADGFRYDEATYYQGRQGKGWHDGMGPNGQPRDLFNYPALVNQYNLIERADAGELDEVWLWGMPYAGFWESHMVGPDGYFVNSNPMTYQGRGLRRFIIMGFNYERGAGETLHDFGHRTESIMKRRWDKARAPENLWERFGRYDKASPGRAEVGLVHWAPNTLTEYEKDNTRTVMSACDNWLHFPTLTGAPRPVTCTEWGVTAGMPSGEVEHQHMKWWLKHLPHAAGQTCGVSNNWWEYCCDPDVF